MLTTPSASGALEKALQLNVNNKIDNAENSFMYIEIPSKQNSYCNEYEAKVVWKLSDDLCESWISNSTYACYVNNAVFSYIFFLSYFYTDLKRNKYTR